MITNSGVHVQKIGGADGTPTPRDIAVHSGRLCRFGGAVWYPLLPHLVFVGLLAYKRSESVENLLWGFLHDAHECVTGDVPRPFKCDCMREEQKAIDLRLFAEYFPDGFGKIDFDLIKKCDMDAGDIEAVALGVPNYVDITVACAKDYDVYREHPHADADDQTLFDRILKSPFFGETHWDGCPGVSKFAYALERARAGFRDHFLYNVEDWNLL